jgi:metal-dependent amidase/aminoacylase/carboxypeptidase family protein
VNGVGGLGPPHRAKDPVSVAAKMVVTLQTRVTRQFDIFDPVVVTVVTFHAGTRHNIIPPEAAFPCGRRLVSSQAAWMIATPRSRSCWTAGWPGGASVMIPATSDRSVTL